jgi:hypothetical protein
LIGFEKGRFVFKILESDYTFVIDEINKTSDDKISYEFKMIFIGKTEDVSNILLILQKNYVHEIIKKKFEIEDINKTYSSVCRRSC